MKGDRPPTRRVRTPPRRLIAPAIVVATCLFFIGLFVVDLVLLHRQRDLIARVALPDDQSHPDFTAKLAVAIQEYDRLKMNATSEIQFDIRAVRPEPSIDSVSLSFLIDRDGSRSYQKITKLTGLEDQPTPQGPKYSRVIGRTKIALPIHPVRGALYYPFDVLILRLQPEGCVNDHVGACIRKDGSTLMNLRIKSVSFETTEELRNQDPNFVLQARTTSDGSIEVVAARKPFVRILSLYCLALSATFFYYLFGITQADKLLPNALGFLAALWGLRELIVPKEVEIFPTIVDYVILIFFGILFALVVSKLYSGGDRHEKSKPS